MRRRLVPLLLLMLTVAWASAQVTVPRFGVRGDVPSSLVDGLADALRSELRAHGVDVRTGELITPGIAGSLDPEFTRLIAQVEGTRFALSGEVATAEPGAEEPYLVNLLAYDAQQERASDLVTRPLSEEVLAAVAEELAVTVAAFTQTRARLPSGNAGLFVSSEPRGAVIYVEGVAIGATGEAGMVMLEPGRYRLELRAEGFLPEVRSVELRASETAFVHVLLTAISGGSIQVASRPSARVYLDDRLVGRTPLTLPARTGRHEMRLERDGFQARVLDVPVRTYRVTRVDAELDPLREPLVYWAEERETIVRIDGELQVGGYAADLQPGVRRIQLRRLRDAVEVVLSVPERGVYRLDLESGQLTQGP